MFTASADRGKNKRAAIVAALVLIGLGVCLALDTPIAAWGLERKMRKQSDLYSLMRVMGFVPTWLVLGTALLLTRPVERRFTRPNILWAYAPLFACALAGGAAAVLKPVFRRLRPDEAEGAWVVLRPFGDNTFKGSGLSMPSEHTAVAFGALFMLCWMFPKGWPVFVLMGVGCAASRLMYADHYLSDVYVAAVLGYAIAWLLVKRFGQRDTAPEPGKVASA